MDRLVTMRVNNILQALRSQQIQKRDVKSKATQNPEMKSDSVEISSKARSLQENKGPEEVGQSMLKELPEIRKERVEDAKKKLEDGF